LQLPLPDEAVCEGRQRRLTIEQAENGRPGSGHGGVDGASGVELRFDSADRGVKGEDGRLEIILERVAPLRNGPADDLAEGDRGRKLEGLAQRSGTSKHDAVLRAIDEEFNRMTHRQRVTDALNQTVERWGDALERLGQ